jgi:hypothetical protein
MTEEITFTKEEVQYLISKNTGKCIFYVAPASFLAGFIFGYMVFSLIY